MLVSFGFFIKFSFLSHLQLPNSIGNTILGNIKLNAYLEVDAWGVWWFGTNTDLVVRMYQIAPPSPNPKRSGFLKRVVIPLAVHYPFTISCLLTNSTLYGNWVDFFFSCLDRRRVVRER